MRTVLLVIGGALYLIPIIGLAKLLARYIRPLHEGLFFAITLILTAASYVQWAYAGGTPAEQTTEIVGLVVFAAFAIVGVRWPYVLAFGWVAHVFWDVLLHPPDTLWVPSWFPPFCVGFDLLLAAYIVWRARRANPTRFPSI
jgi:hypothetical protein